VIHLIEKLVVNFHLHSCVFPISNHLDAAFEYIADKSYACFKVVDVFPAKFCAEGWIYRT
jgi:hypothetical protein